MVKASALMPIFFERNWRDSVQKRLASVLLLGPDDLVSRADLEM